MKKITISIGILLITTVSLTAQVNRIAYISRDTITGSIPGYVQKTKEVQDLLKTYQNEIQSKRDALNQKLAALLQSYNVKPEETQQQILARMSSKDTASIGMLREEEKVIIQTEKLYTNKINSLYEEQVKPIDNKVATAIKNYAVRNKLDMIYFIEDISPALAYINTRRSLTKDIIKEVALTK